MYNYTRVPCHVARNLVAKGSADSDVLQVILESWFLKENKICILVKMQMISSFGECWYSRKIFFLSSPPPCPGRCHSSVSFVAYSEFCKQRAQARKCNWSWHGTNNVWSLGTKHLMPIILCVGQMKLASIICNWCNRTMCIWRKPRPLVILLVLFIGLRCHLSVKSCLTFVCTQTWVAAPGMCWRPFHDSEGPVMNGLQYLQTSGAD